MFGQPNLANFILMAKARRVLTAVCFCGLFIGLKGVAVATAALALATEHTIAQLCMIFWSSSEIVLCRFVNVPHGTV